MKHNHVPDSGFWNAFIDNHILSGELVERFKATLLTTPWTPLGGILVSEGFLKLNEVSGLLAIQEKEPKERIGDLAIREGYCTSDQIEKALHVQKQSSPGAIDLILREVPEGDNLTRALVSYIHYLEGVLCKKQGA